MLPRAEKFARAALLQVALGNFESVRCGHHRFDALPRISSDRFGRHKDAIRFLLSAPDPCRAAGAAAPARSGRRARSPSRSRSARPRRPRSPLSPPESAARRGGIAPSPNLFRHSSAARAAGPRAVSEKHSSPAARIPPSPLSAPASIPRSPDKAHTPAARARFRAAEIPTRRASCASAVQRVSIGVRPGGISSITERSRSP